MLRKGGVDYQRFGEPCYLHLQGEVLLLMLVFYFNQDFDLLRIKHEENKDT